MMKLQLLFLAIRFVFSDLLRNQFYEITKKIIPLPWLTSVEIHILSKFLSSTDPEYCLEWGAGYSTVYLPKRIRNLKKWISIEHDQQWYATIKSKIKDEHVELIHIPPDNYPWSDKDKDGSYSDLEHYIEYPGDLNLLFDFVLVDGRARNECLNHASDLISPSGFVFLHDAQRPYYQNSIEKYKFVFTFIDPRYNKTIVIISNSIDPNSIFNIGHLDEMSFLINRLHHVVTIPIKKIFGHKMLEEQVL
jgi:predicted O-methyltransferase YrrM